MFGNLNQTGHSTKITTGSVKDIWLGKEVLWDFYHDYVPTAGELMPVYPFIIRGEGEDSEYPYGDEESSTLYLLNHGGDDFRSPGEVYSTEDGDSNKVRTKFTQQENQLSVSAVMTVTVLKNIIATIPGGPHPICANLTLVKVMEQCFRPLRWRKDLLSTSA